MTTNQPMTTTNTEPHILRVGQAEIGLDINSGCLRSITGVMVNGTALRNPLARFLPWFDSYEGEVFDRFEFLGIEQSGEETRIRLRAVSNVDYPFRERSAISTTAPSPWSDGRAVDVLTGEAPVARMLQACRVYQMESEE